MDDWSIKWEWELPKEESFVADRVWLRSLRDGITMLPLRETPFCMNNNLFEDVQELLRDIELRLNTNAGQAEK